MFLPEQEIFVPVFGHRLALRCTAKSKRSGKRCCGFAVKGYSVCRMHGCGGGPKTQEEGVARIASANTKHGRETRAIRLTRQTIRLRLELAILVGNAIKLFEKRTK